MKKHKDRLSLVYESIIAILTWFALVLQLYILIKNRHEVNRSISDVMIFYFSFFTVLTNTLVALSLSSGLLFPKSKWGAFFSHPFVSTAVVLYIVSVGLGYNLLLRHLWNPQGLQLIADELLHSVVPMLYFVYWFVFVPKEKLEWRKAWKWMIYPFFYLIYALIRGAVSGLYPYPFINAMELGYSKVFLASALLFLVFIVIGALFILIDYLLHKAHSSPRESNN